MIQLKSFFLNIFLFLTSTLLAFGIAEISFHLFVQRPKLFFDYEDAGQTIYKYGIGWTPIMDGAAYSKDGILLKKSYIRGGRQRVLVLGDSVVARGFVTDAFAVLISTERTCADLYSRLGEYMSLIRRRKKAEINTIEIFRKNIGTIEVS